MNCKLFLMCKRGWIVNIIIMICVSVCYSCIDFLGGSVITRCLVVTPDSVRVEVREHHPGATSMDGLSVAQNDSLIAWVDIADAVIKEISIDNDSVIVKYVKVLFEWPDTYYLDDEEQYLKAELKGTLKSSSFSYRYVNNDPTISAHCRQSE